MKISAIITFALIGLATAQDFRKQNADDAEKKTEDFKKLTPDSPCNDGDLACVKDQFAQCANGKFALSSCGGDLKCVVLPLVNSPGTSITCSTEQDRLNRLAEARGESPKDNGKGKENIKMPGNDGKGNDNADKGKGNNNADQPPADQPPKGKGNNNADQPPSDQPPNDAGKGKGKDDAGKGKDNNDAGKGKGNNDAGKGKGKDDAGKGKGNNNADQPPNDADKGKGKDNNNAGKGKDNNDAGKGKGNNDAGKGKGKDDAGKGKGNNNADQPPNDAGKGKGNNNADQPPNDAGKGKGNNNVDQSPNDAGKGKGNNNADQPPNDAGKGKGNNNADQPPANQPPQGKGKDNAAQPPENPKGKGSGNLAEIRKKNADEADKLNEDFKKLTPDSPCKDGDQACVNDQFAQCVNGKFVSTNCGPGLKCAALPLVLKEGTSIACTSEEDRKKRIDDARNNRK